jgi:transmembrane sensor
VSAPPIEERGVSAPIKDRLRDVADEPALQRMWAGIAGRLSHARPARADRRPLGLALCALGGAAAVVAALGFVERDRGPLHLADGLPLAMVTAPPSGARLSLSDGSSIELGAGARFEPVESSGSTFLAILQRGDASFDVRPGGPRRWQIECGLATVEVVGTHFRCERRADALRVSVQRGVVLVRGERVPDRVRRLSADESLEIAEPAPAPPATAPPPAAEALAPSTSSFSLSPPGAERVGVRGSWRELAGRGRHREAFDALGARGLRRESARLGVADLLALADVARLSGHPADAVAPLERILSAFTGDPQAPLAAFALARIDLDELARPRQAAAALERALSLGTPQSLREDARARLVEAYGRAGERAAARRAAEAYAREFPGGRYTAAVDPWLAGARANARD